MWLQTSYNTILILDTIVCKMGMTALCFNFIIFKYLYMCVTVCRYMHLSTVPQRPEELDLPGDGVPGG